ncbi:MAG: hypothetical protein V3R99_13230 [Thermoguttaceae bacterium]
MPSRIVNAEQDERRREIRLRIGRLRRRIDRRVRTTQKEARRLVSWQTYVRSSPGNAILGALGVGLALSAGLSMRRLSGWLGLRMIRRAADRGSRLFWKEIADVWNDSTPAKTEPTGAADDGATNERA